MKSIRITAGGYTFVAIPHPDAPKTVAAFSALLPYRQKIIHVRWSGEACWIPLGDFDLKIGFENHTSHPSVGDILFYPGGFSETEILIAYGSCSLCEQGRAAGRQPLPHHRRGQGKLARRSASRCCGAGAKDILFEKI